MRGSRVKMGVTFKFARHLLLSLSGWIVKYRTQTVMCLVSTVYPRLEALTLCDIMIALSVIEKDISKGFVFHSQ